MGIHRRLYRAWCWWRLYSRTPQRILFHDKELKIAFATILGDAEGTYPFFEAACWLLLVLIFAGRFLEVPVWMLFYVLLGVLILIRDWRASDKSRMQNDCNELREQGYWFPNWMTVSTGRRAFVTVVSGILQIFLTVIIVAVGLFFFARK